MILRENNSWRPGTHYGTDCGLGTEDCRLGTGDYRLKTAFPAFTFASMKLQLACLFLCSMTLLLSGCKTDQRTELFEMSHFIDFELQAGLNTLETHFYRTSGIQSQFQAQLDALGRPASDVVSVTPKYAELSTVFGDQDLDFIRQVFVRIYDLSDPENTNSEIFYLDPVPPNTRKVIRPFPGLSNVRDIAAEPVFGVEVGISLWEVTPRSFDMRLEFELSANVD